MRQILHEIPISSGSASYREPKLICRKKEADFFQLWLIIDLLNYVGTMVLSYTFPKLGLLKRVNIVTCKIRTSW